MRHEAGSIIINSSHVDLDFVSAYQVRKYNNVFFWYKGGCQAGVMTVGVSSYGGVHMRRVRFMYSNLILTKEY